MDKQIITFKQTFEDLNRMGNGSLFRIDDEKIAPIGNRVKLIFIDALYGGPFSSYYLQNLPKQELMNNIKNNFEDYLTKNFIFSYNSHNKKNIIDFAKKFDNTTVIIQSDKKEHLRNYLISTEELGHLVSMLYFREKGYIVQKPLRAYGKTDGSGVDDVIAWRSPIIEKLANFGYIDKGCHISELYCLRWLEKYPNSSQNGTDDMILIEVEQSIQKGISDIFATEISKSPSLGINQLIRAKKENVVRQLFICFPIIGKDIERLLIKIKNYSGDGPMIGAILFGDKGIQQLDSGIFSNDKMSSEIKIYERNLKKVLINNFYFEEILEIIVETGLDLENKGIEEVVTDFYDLIEKIDINYILQKLDKIKNIR